MRWKYIPFVLLLVFVSLYVKGEKTGVKKPVNYKIHTFYYSWFGNPQFDGKYNNWDHLILPHWRDKKWDNAGRFKGGDDIGANFYPELGAYSSNDTAVILRHMEQIKDAGIGVLALSWWGINSYTDKSVSLYLDVAQQFGLKITFHIEPVYKNIEQFKSQIEYISAKYLQHPAIFKYKNKPMFYVYDSGKIKHHEWNKLLGIDGEITLRNTVIDAIFIGHWERRRDGEFITNSGFDGFYTYYASEGFLYGSTSSNWPFLAEFAKENDLIFIPCAGPGYADTRIRPWNTRNQKDRENGKYYERMFLNAVNVNPDFIGITSFNEWHEGTQIEPAVPKSNSDYTYENYGPETDPCFYIKKTRELVDIFSR